MKKLITSSALTALTMVGLVSPVFAEDIDIKPKGQWENLGGITFPNLISGLIRLILVAAALIFFFMLVIGGIRWMLSGGDKAGTEAARGQITAALIGLLIVFIAWAIITLINALFGIDILKLEIPTFTG